MISKNIYRLFKDKKFQILGICLIIALSSFIYVAMYNGMNSIEQSQNKFTQDYNREDYCAEITNALDKDDINERINDFKNYYKLSEVEFRKSKDILFEHNDESYKVRALTDASDIDLTKIESGRKPQKDNEIGLPRIFLKDNNLKIGDKININGKDYSIVSEVLFPDYTMLMFTKEFSLDNKRITVGLFTNDEYENLKGKEYYKFAIKTDNKIDNENIPEKFSYISSIVETKENMMSGYLDNEIKLAKSAVLGLSVIINFIAIIVIGIIVYKILSSQSSQIGILKAMGYLNKEILNPYLKLIIIISSTSLVFGGLLGTFASKPLISLFGDFYLFPYEGVIIDYMVYVKGILVPFIFFVILSYYIIWKMVKKKPLMLLNKLEKTKTTLFTKFLDIILRKCKTTTKFKYLFLLKDKGKFYTFIIGIVFTTFLIVITLMMPSFYYKMTTEVYNIFDYKYEGAANISKGELKINDNEEKALVMPVKYNGKSAVIKGIDKDNKLYTIHDEGFNNITEKLDDEDTVIISNSFSFLNDVNKGDKINLDINGENKSFKVADISKQFGACEIYILRSTLSKIYTNESSDDMYNIVYSDKQLDEDEFSYVIDKQDVINQSKFAQHFLFICIGILGVTSIIIASIVLIVLSSLTVESNYYNISVLKVLGYSKQEVNKIILNSYLVYSIIIYLFTVPIYVLFIEKFFKSLGREFNTVLPFVFQWWQLFAGLFIIITIYFLGTFSAKKKINKISLQETLKEWGDN